MRSTTPLCCPHRAVFHANKRIRYGSSHLTLALSSKRLSVFGQTTVQNFDLPSPALLAGEGEGEGPFLSSLYVESVL